MCFSAEASFTASSILTIAGIVLAKKFYNSKKIFLALIPLFFGIQQFAEGVLWVTLESGTYPRIFSMVAQYIYLFFAYMFWPVWIPFAFVFPEKILWRKIVMYGLMALGSLFFFKVGHDFIFYGDAEARILKHSIDYGDSSWSHKVLYGFITMTPFFISHVPKMWILGIANLIVFVIASISYYYVFTSIWCFACAIMTIGLFILLEIESADPAVPRNKSSQ